VGPVQDVCECGKDNVGAGQIEVEIIFNTFVNRRVYYIALRYTCNRFIFHVLNILEIDLSLHAEF